MVTGRASAGTYDWRGQEPIRALRDVILYAAGEINDVLGRSIDQVAPTPVLHDNIGLIGASNGGNIIVAAAALHGADLTSHLRCRGWKGWCSPACATTCSPPPTSRTFARRSRAGATAAVGCRSTPARPTSWQVDPTVDPSLLPNNAPNTPPANWSNPAAYCIGEGVPESVCQLAAVWQMADRVHTRRVLLPLIAK